MALLSTYSTPMPRLMCSPMKRRTVCMAMQAVRSEQRGTMNSNRAAGAAGRDRAGWKLYKSERKDPGRQTCMPLGYLRNPNRATTCRYHIPHVVGYVVAYVAPACWGRHCRRPSTGRRNCEVADAQTTKQFHELSSRVGNCFARSPTIARLFESAPRTLPVKNPPHRVCNLVRGSRASGCFPLRVGVAGRDMLPPVGTARLVWVSRRLSFRRDKGKSAAAKAAAVAVGDVTKRRRKSTQVGRVARRARPVMWRHVWSFRHVENRYPALP